MLWEEVEDLCVWGSISFGVFFVGLEISVVIMEIVWSFFMKLEIEIFYDIIMLLLSMYLKRIKI